MWGVQPCEGSGPCPIRAQRIGDKGQFWKRRRGGEDTLRRSSLIWRTGQEDRRLRRLLVGLLAASLLLIGAPAFAQPPVTETTVEKNRVDTFVMPLPIDD